MLDIIKNRVNLDDVLVIISRTNFNPNNDTHWQNIWDGYLYGGLGYDEWRGYDDQEDNFRKLAKDLYNCGKLHQPKQFGSSYPIRRSQIWLETVLPPSELELNPAAKKAWEHFQTVAGLVNIKLDKEYH